MLFIQSRKLDNQEIRDTLDHYWKATVARDIDRSHDIYHDEVIVEFPQSGELISGKHNIYELRAHYPAKLITLPYLYANHSI